MIPIRFLCHPIRNGLILSIFIIHSSNEFILNDNHGFSNKKLYPIEKKKKKKSMIGNKYWTHRNKYIISFEFHKTNLYHWDLYLNTMCRYAFSGK